MSDKDNSPQDSLTFGQKAADMVSAVCGSWMFIWGFLAATAGWMAFNSTSLAFDRFPYTLWIMLISVLAIVLSSIILLAGNRQGERDRQHAETSYAHTDEILSLQRTQMDRFDRQDEMAQRQHQQMLDRLAFLEGLLLPPKEAS